MTENGASRTLHLHTVPFHESGRCAASVSCGAPAEPRERAPYEAHQLNNDEARLLTAAVRVAEDDIERGAGELADAVALARRTEIEAHTAVRDVERVVAEAEVAQARVNSVQDRHRWDGAESRLVKRRWVSVVTWAATIAAACYDTAFFLKMFLKMIDRPWSWSDPVSYAALLPGPLIAAGLLLCGHGVAQAFARSRAQWERKTQYQRKDPDRRRSADDLPWPDWRPPLVFLALLLITVAIWALIRARDFSHVDPPVRLAFTLLLLVFNLTCVGLKVLQYNPYAETKKLAEATLATVAARERQAIESATAKITAHTEATYALRTAVSRLQANGLHKMDEAWEAILRDRDGHGRTGEIAPEFAPAGRWRFAGVKMPSIQVASMDEVVGFADDLDPGEVRTRLAVAIEGRS
ncbi:MAG TPA: hypothetical protein VGL47_10805 [Amycolatopsis sp.]|uniref:Uncharacterized protein n=1 Tax=Amycolatopsis nalaikhensis TaxID=715472 RepID=A0ABY8Y056_9PSEU|nr:hypothetical protein [Amycolatopsis sp. 2-2]WIV61032.1 hypothetical protein QP939_21740 [Amycolatopsis sp. 2-2]